MKKLDHKNNERVIVFLDGSNFYHRLRDKELDFKQLLKFDFRKFAEWLAHRRSIVECLYYVGVIRKETGNAKSQQLVSDQQRLFAYLQSPQQDWHIVRGHMMKYDSIYKEKGVDVRLALDVLEKAYEDVYDTAILVSSDTDLIPAIVKAKRLNRKIEYIGFSHRPSFAMQKYADLSRLLTKEDLEPFLP